jgi:hypothetical protein
VVTLQLRLGGLPSARLYCGSRCEHSSAIAADESSGYNVCMTAPHVNVMIDPFNHEVFIEKAVRSVLEQVFPSGDRKVNGGQASAFLAATHK